MLLPACERRGEIHFIFGKSLAYNVRLAVAFTLIAAGLVVETVFIDSKFWLGLPPILIGVSLLLTKGYDNLVRAKSKNAQWRPARHEEVVRIPELNKKQKEWDQDAIDITSLRGFASLLLAGLAVFLLAMFAYGMGGSMAIRIFMLVFANAAVMLLPFWITGVRSILKNDQLVTKANLLLGVEEAFERMGKRDGEEFQYQLETADSDHGSAPCDVKAILGFHDAPEEFLGIQMQIAINSVQGADYPYFYCVLVAKSGFKGLRNVENELRSTGVRVVVEPGQDKDVDIVVIRQKTTKNSGFHTKQQNANGLIEYAVKQARECLST